MSWIKEVALWMVAAFLVGFLINSAYLVFVRPMVERREQVQIRLQRLQQLKRADERDNERLREFAALKSDCRCVCDPGTP